MKNIPNGIRNLKKWVLNLAKCIKNLKKAEDLKFCSLVKISPNLVTLVGERRVYGGLKREKTSAKKEEERGATC